MTTSIPSIGYPKWKYLVPSAPTYADFVLACLQYFNDHPKNIVVHAMMSDEKNSILSWSNSKGMSCSDGAFGFDYTDAPINPKDIFYSCGITRSWDELGRPYILIDKLTGMPVNLERHIAMLTIKKYITLNSFKFIGNDTTTKTTRS